MQTIRQFTALTIALALACPFANAQYNNTAGNPLRSVLPGVGTTVGVDLTKELLNGTILPVANGGSGGSTGLITVPYGGTGLTTLTSHGVLTGAGTGNVVPTAAGTNGQLLTGSTGAAPVFATLTSTGATITPTTGAGTLNLDVASGSVTSTQLSPDTIQHATVALSAANLIAMYTTPVALIAAPAAGKNIIVHHFMFTMVASSTAFTSGGVVAPQIGNTAHGAGTLTTATVAAAVVTAGAGTTYTTTIPVSYTGTAATGLYISNQTAAFATGTGTAVADIWYSIQ